MNQNSKRPIHPGEIIQHEYMKPLKLDKKQIATAIGVTQPTIEKIISGNIAITPDTAFRLAKYLNTSPDFWIKLQNNVDMWETFQIHKNEYDKIENIL